MGESQRIPAREKDLFSFSRVQQYICGQAWRKSCSLSGPTCLGGTKMQLFGVCVAARTLEHVMDPNAGIPLAAALAMLCTAKRAKAKWSIVIPSVRPSTCFIASFVSLRDSRERGRECREQNKRQRERERADSRSLASKRGTYIHTTTGACSQDMDSPGFTPSTTFGDI